MEECLRQAQKINKSESGLWTVLMLVTLVGSQSFSSSHQIPNAYTGRPKNGKIVRMFSGHQQEIYSLGQPYLTRSLMFFSSVPFAEFSHDGRKIVSGSGDKTARIWDLDGLSVLGPRDLI